MVISKKETFVLFWSLIAPLSVLAALMFIPLPSISNLWKCIGGVSAILFIIYNWYQNLNLANLKKIEHEKAKIQSVTNELKRDGYWGAKLLILDSWKFKHSENKDFLQQELKSIDEFWSKNTKRWGQYNKAEIDSIFGQKLEPITIYRLKAFQEGKFEAKEISNLIGYLNSISGKNWGMTQIDETIKWLIDEFQKRGGKI